MFYVYIWKTANGVPFYVGKGTGDRAFDVRPGRRSAHFMAIHEKGGCYAEIVDQFVLEAEAHAYEAKLIEFYGRRDLGGILVNMTDGCEGRVGSIFTPEHRANISAVQRGRRQSPETIQKRREAMLKKQSDPEYWATRRRAGDAIRGVPRTDEVRAAISAKNRGRVRSAEARAKYSRAKLGKPASEKSRLKSAAARRMLPPSHRNTSGYKGVSFNRLAKKWEVNLSVDGHRHRLGTFSSKQEAARAYDAAAVAAWGLGNCFLNFPEEAAHALAG